MVNSRLPVYKAYYGDVFGDTIAGLFTRIAPKLAPLVKQLGIKVIDVNRDKGINAVENLAGKAFSTAKNKITSLVRRKMQPPAKSLVLPSTTVMPEKISKARNSAVEEKLASLETPSMATTPLYAHSNTIANMIAGSSFKQKINSKNFHSKNFHR